MRQFFARALARLLGQIDRWAHWVDEQDHFDPVLKAELEKFDESLSRLRKQVAREERQRLAGLCRDYAADAPHVYASGKEQAAAQDMATRLSVLFEQIGDQV